MRETFSLEHPETRRYIILHHPYLFMQVAGQRVCTRTPVRRPCNVLVIFLHRLFGRLLAHTLQFTFLSRLSPALFTRIINCDEESMATSAEGSTDDTEAEEHS